MSDFLLIHGAWHGAWCWEPVVSLLSARGQVSTPTLGGLGERHAELSPEICLHSHLDDVLTALDSLTSKPVVCAHSYGGMLARGLVDKAADRIGAVLYLDAYVPRSGQSGLDLRSPQANHDLWETLEKGWRVPPPSAAVFGLPPGELRDWVQERLTAMTVDCFRQSFPLTYTSLRHPPAVYVRTDWPNPGLDKAFEEFLAQGLPAERWNCGHEAMLERPQDLARLLLELGHSLAP